MRADAAKAAAQAQAQHVRMELLQTRHEQLRARLRVAIRAVSAISPKATARWRAGPFGRRESRSMASC